MKTVEINRESSTAGTILVTVQGYTLYQDTADTQAAPACTGTCLTVWPPVLLPTGAKTAKAGKGVNQKKLGTWRRADITGDPLQVTYNGFPLYRYVPDNLTKGSTTGNGHSSGKWHVVSP